MTKVYCIIIIQFAISLFCFAEDVITINNEPPNSFFFTSNIEYFEDTSNSIVFKEISDSSFQNQFEEYIDSNAVFFIRNSQSTYWLKLCVRTDSLQETPLLLLNLNQHVDTCEVWYYDNVGVLKHYISGENISFSNRAVKTKNQVFPFELDSIAKPVYVRVRSKQPQQVMLKISSNARYLPRIVFEYYAYGLFYGILIFILMYSIVLFLILQESVFLKYSLYIVSCILLTLDSSGIGYHFIWPELPQINIHIVGFFPFLYGLFFLIYSYSFLRMSSLSTIYTQFTKLTIGIYVVVFLLDYWAFKLNGGFLIASFFMLSYFVLALLLRIKGNKLATFYIIAYLPVISQFILQSLKANHIIEPRGYIWVYSFEISLLLEMIMFSIALTYRLLIEKNQKEIAQQKELSNLIEMQKWKDDENIRLENIIDERTSELKDVNSQLEEYAYEIKQKNILLNIDNKRLLDKIDDAVKARVFMEDIDFDQFCKIYPTSEECLSYLYDIKSKLKYMCIKCSYDKYSEGKDLHSRRCNKCGYNESATAHTVFHKVKFTLNKAFYIVFLVYAHQGSIKASELSTILNLREQTCLVFSRKVKDVISLRKKQGEKFRKGWSSIILTHDIEK